MFALLQLFVSFVYLSSANGYNYYDDWYYWRRQERIVTDLKVIESPHGVPIDFSYNETKYGDGRLNSVPGCPKSVDGYPWLYYGNRCFLTSYQGPCPHRTLLFAERGSRHGICGCECFQYVSQRESLSSPDGRFKFCNAFSDQVQDTTRNVCYNLQEQGPCRHGEWLVRDRSGSSATCVRECPSDSEGPLYYDHWTGECTRKWVSKTSRNERPGYSYSGECPLGHKTRFRYSPTLRRCVPSWPSQEDFMFIP